MPNNIPTTNPPAVLRNRQLANHYFGADAMGQPMRSIPRYKYMFYANFVVSSAALNMYHWLGYLGDPSRGISFKIKTIDKPKLELNTVELNQYNRKRYAYTKVEYQPLTVRLYDTVDNKPLDLWKQYFTYYFGDSRLKTPLNIQNSPTDPIFDDNTGWGFRPINTEIFFFDRIELYSLYGGKYTKVEYIHPKITNVDWQQYDTSSSEPDELQLTMRYEALQYYDSSEITPELAAVFGFDVDSPVLEPRDSVSGAIDTYAKRQGGVNQFEIWERNRRALNKSSVISTNRSVLSNFGLNSAVYTRYTANPNPTDNPAATAPGYAQVDRKSPYDYYADAVRPGAPNILGITDGSLPSVTRVISLASRTTFASSPVSISSALTTFGNFNFGG